MNLYSNWTALLCLTLFACQNPTDGNGDLAKQNELLTSSNLKDLNQLEESPIYKWFGSSFPHECKPYFDFLTDNEVLANRSLANAQLESLSTLKKLLHRHRRVIGETDIMLFDHQVAELQNWIANSDFSEGDVERIRHSLLNLQKTLFCSHLSDQYYASFSVIDTLGLRVFPHNEVVEVGDTFRADLFMTCFETIEIHDFIVYREMDTTKYPTEFRNPVDTIRRKQSSPTFEIAVEETGPQKYYVLAIVEENHGRQLQYIREINFEVKN